MHRGRTVLAMDCVLAGAEQHCGRPLNGTVSRHGYVVSEELWKRVDRAINQAQTREVTISELNRLLGKWGLGAPPGYISERSSIRQEWLTAQQLGQFRRGHTRTDVRQFGAPLVAVEFGGRTYMLDGTNRINVWLRDGESTTHEVIILGRANHDG